MTALQTDPANVAAPTVTVEGVSKWFGQKVAVSDLSCSFGPGVAGLLGPNGADNTDWPMFFFAAVCNNFKQFLCNTHWYLFRLY